MENVKQISFSTVAANMNKLTTITDGKFILSFSTPYTRRCCDVSKNGVLLGRRYTVKSVMQLVDKNR